MTESIVIDVRAGAAHESQSGLQMNRPRIWGVFNRVPSSRVAAMVIHPTSNFMGHYLLEPLGRRGIPTLGLNTRYAGNDVSLLFERAIQDLGAGVKWLRGQGFDAIVLIGNSGGGSLVSLYQAQAEHLDITATPAGDPIDLLPADLPPAQGIVLAAAHLGRSRTLEKWIDPSVIDESDVLSADPELDMFNPRNGPPYSKDFLARYRAAQIARLTRLEQWAKAKLRQLRATPSNPRDMPFIVHRTVADPRCADPAIEPNDRAPMMTLWGPPRAQNYAVNAFARYTSLTSFLSQWALCSRADGPASLACTSVPVLLMEHTADSSVFPGDNDTWAQAAAGRVRRHKLQGATHYMVGQDNLIESLADEISEFARRL